ncbi:MAG: GNAT family N-acetyltransferase [Pseudomonadota bacterium]
MFRIRTIHDDIHPANRHALEQVRKIMLQQFDGVSDHDYDSVRGQLLNPFAKRFKTTLYAAENGRGKVLGFAVLMHDPEANFCYLDYIASARGLTSRGIGGALYQRVREESLLLKAHGLFFECLPDDETAVSSPALAQQNKGRLRFYEQFGARPIANTDYERPLNPGDLDMPHLVYDDLDRGAPLRRSVAKRVVRAILERKYAGLCPAEYVEAVLKSFRSDPVDIRPARYTKQPRTDQITRTDPIALVVNEHHDIHQVRDRGYVEAPVRVRAILREIETSASFERLPARHFPDSHITAVHSHNLVNYLKKACEGIKPENSIYPYVIPVRNAASPPKALDLQAGYYCIDTFTPLNEQAYKAARAAVDCTLTAAQEIAEGRHFAYALVRPPGHHAESRVFGGFCYLNNTAIAAHRLSKLGRVAILDIDYHHGNGQQEIFYQRADVLTVSIHGHPSFAYPYFSGHRAETGEGEGTGFNLNFPLDETCSTENWQKTLREAIRRIRDFRPDFLVLALGLDTARGDPTGSWTMGPADFEENGRLIGAMQTPTLIVQEGGYRTRTLGTNARRFFAGLLAGLDAARLSKRT